MNTLTATTLDPEVVEDRDAAAHALWVWSHHWNPEQTEGLQPGRFTRALFAAIDAADPKNRARLASAFPREVEAHRLVLGELGLPALRRIAAGQAPESDR